MRVFILYERNLTLKMIDIPANLPSKLDPDSGTQKTISFEYWYWVLLILKPILKQKYIIRTHTQNHI